ncbi:DNA-binding transcriptional regulator BolA [Buchnera aphidicola (Takecallis arundicolens)]|uniref:BolA family protein n=1 Tax=Buchnera aphidicola TaxID=9 RepID=UPI003464E885
MLKKIKKYFNTKLVKIYDNTMQHKNQNQKKHLTIFIVSDIFKNKNILKRHQEVYNVLSKEMCTIIHALSIHTYTMNEWKKCYMKDMHNIKCHQFTV